MAAKSVEHDKFCWVCTGDETTVKCSHCIRSFHDECIENNQGNIDDGKNGWCSVCIELDSAKGTDTKEQLDMLPIMINRVFNDEEFDPLKDPLKCVKDRSKYESLVNPINLTQIKDNIRTYTSFCELLIDIEWILNNCLVLFPVKHIMVKTAQLLRAHLEINVESVKKCAECYSNAINNLSNWSTMVCAKPHLVLWAKIEGWNYWPVKLMSIDGQMLNIRFFGDYTQAKVEATKCFFYSEAIPMKAKKRSAAYKLALNEVNVYIKNLITKFGSYHVFKTKTRFDPTLLSRYFPDFIPVAANSGLPSTTLDDSIDCSSDSFTNAENGQNQYDTYLLTIGEDGCLNEDWTIDLTNQANDDQSEYNEPNRERARHSNDNDGELADESDVDSSVDNSNDSITADPEVEESNTSIAESSTEGLNIENCQEMDSPNNAFDFMCNLNEKFQEEMKKLAEKHKQEIKLLGNRNKRLTDQLNAQKLEHNKMIKRKNEERMDAVNEAKKQCKEEYDRRLEDAKKQTFCPNCDTAIPDAFNFCNSRCQREYWTMNN